jgi:hypothetical protein
MANIACLTVSPQHSVHNTVFTACIHVSQTNNVRFLSTQQYDHAISRYSYYTGRTRTSQRYNILRPMSLPNWHTLHELDTPLIDHIITLHNTLLPQSPGCSSLHPRDTKNAAIHNHSQYTKEIPTSHPIILTIIFSNYLSSLNNLIISH